MAAVHGNFNTKGNCTFVPVENGAHAMSVTCPNTLQPGTNTTSLVNLGMSSFTLTDDPPLAHPYSSRRMSLTSALLPARSLRREPQQRPLVRKCQLVLHRRPWLPRLSGYLDQGRYTL